MNSISDGACGSNPQRHDATRSASATLDDLREAVTTLENTERIARRVFGGAHPLTTTIEGNLKDSRVALRAREASA